MNDVDACDMLAFALYGAKRYEEALGVFKNMEEASNAEEDQRGIAMVWQGHVLDLLGRREEAIALYRKAVNLGLETVRGHNHYGLPEAFTPYAKERMERPFVRVDNRSEY
jgi:tetratricopeptide (TPR) repeat protein